MLRLKFKITEEDRYSRVDSLLKRFSLDHCTDTLINVLSKVEVRRLTLASSLLTNPSVLLIDDFNAGLDSRSAVSLLAHLRSLKKTIIVVLHQPTVRMMTYVDDLCLLESHGRTLYVGPCERALSVFHVKCPMNTNPTDFFLREAANARPTNPVVKTVICEAILQEQLLTIKSTTQFVTGMTYSASKSYASSFFQQIYWLTWRSLSKRGANGLIHPLLQSAAIALIYGFADFGVEHSVFTQTTVQDVAGLLVRLLVTITRVCSLLIIVSPSIDHDLLVRESTQQRWYSIAAFYVSKCFLEIPVFIVIVLFSVSITVIFTGLQQFFQLCAIFLLTTLCSTALSCLLAAMIHEKEPRLLLWMFISQILSIVNGFYINTRSIPFALKWVPYVSFYYYSFSLALLSQWNNVDHIACSTSHWNSTTMRCNNNGADVLFSFNVEKNKNGFYWMMLLGLTVVFHVLSYLVLRYKLRR